jgi:hypothetical protein
VKAYKISVSKLLKPHYFGDRQVVVRYSVIEFKEMGFEDSRWMEPNRSSPVNDFQVTGVNLLKPLAIITTIASSLSVFTVYISVKCHGQVVSTLGLLSEVVDFISASSQIAG